MKLPRDSRGGGLCTGRALRGWFLARNGGVLELVENWPVNVVEYAIDRVDRGGRIAL